MELQFSPMFYLKVSMCRRSLHSVRARTPARSKLSMHHVAAGHLVHAALPCCTWAACACVCVCVLMLGLTCTLTPLVLTLLPGTST